MVHCKLSNCTYLDIRFFVPFQTSAQRMGRFVFQDIRLIRPIRCLRYKVTTFSRNMQALNPLFFSILQLFFQPQIELIKQVVFAPQIKLRKRCVVPIITPTPQP